MVITSTCVLLEQTSIRDLRHLGVVTILYGIGSSLSTMAPQLINIDLELFSTFESSRRIT